VLGMSVFMAANRPEDVSPDCAEGYVVQTRAMLWPNAICLALELTRVLFSQSWARTRETSEGDTLAPWLETEVWPPSEGTTFNISFYLPFYMRLPNLITPSVNIGLLMALEENIKKIQRIKRGRAIANR
jgi:hypothetical protein